MIVPGKKLIETFPRTATKGEIMKAYRNLAREWHPDAYDGEDQEMAEKKFLDLAAAKEVLTDPGTVLYVAVATSVVNDNNSTWYQTMLFAFFY